MLNARRFCFVSIGGLVRCQGVCFDSVNKGLCAIETMDEGIKICKYVDIFDYVSPIDAFVWVDKEFDIEKPIYEQHRLTRYLNVKIDFSSHDPDNS